VSQSADVKQEMKVFEIASTLLDVINVVPAAQQKSTSLIRQEPRQVFHGLSSLLASMSDGNSHLLTLLQSKISQSQVPFVSIPRLMETDEEPVPETIPQLNTRSIPQRSDHDNNTLKYVPPDPIQLRGLGMSDWIA
jgi:hypothetical protein